MDVTTTAAGYAEAYVAAHSLQTGHRHGTSPDLCRRSDGLSRALAFSDTWDREHELHIASLAAGLFRDLRPLHGLGEEALMLLDCASRIADDRSCDVRLLVETRLHPLLDVHGVQALSFREVTVVTAIARHGAGSPLPERDRSYWHLADRDRDTVRWCAAILLTAKGFDADQRGTVRSLLAAQEGDELVIVAGCEGDADFNVAEGTRAAATLAWKTRARLRVVEIGGFAA
jgi:hypothetical protein